MQELTPEQRYFYLFLLTNDKTKQCGIYEITKRQICYDTGYNIDTVSKLLQYFISSDKIRYNPETNELAIKNWRKYNESSSPKVQSCINQELSTIKDKTLIEYLYSIDTQSQKNKNKIQEKEEDKIDSVFDNGTWESEKKQFLIAEQWQMKQCSEFGLSKEQIVLSVNEFLEMIEGQEDYKSMKELKKHWYNWYKKKKTVISNIGKTQYEQEMEEKRKKLATSK